jgi:hypothetical protein
VAVADESRSAAAGGSSFRCARGRADILERAREIPLELLAADRDRDPVDHPRVGPRQEPRHEQQIQGAGLAVEVNLLGHLDGHAAFYHLRNVEVHVVAALRLGLLAEVNPHLRDLVFELSLGRVPHGVEPFDGERRHLGGIAQPFDPAVAADAHLGREDHADRTPLPVEQDGGAGQVVVGAHRRHHRPHAAAHHRGHDEAAMRASITDVSR